MPEVLMPFARHLVTNSIVDVASVKRGDAAGYVCWSCGMTVVAKQGKVKAWHFAHLVTSLAKNTACEFSFDVALRAIIRDVLKANGAIQLPGINNSQLPKPMVPDSTTILARHQGVLFDAVLSKGDYRLCLVFCDSNRLSAAVDFNPNPHTAVLGLAASKQFGSKSTRGNYRALIEGWLSESTAHKHWILHPKLRKTQGEPSESIEGDQKPAPGLLHHAKPNTGHASSERFRGFKAGVTYECERHRTRWTGHQICQLCGPLQTPKYAREVSK